MAVRLISAENVNFKQIFNCMFLALFHFFSHLTLDGFVKFYDEFAVSINDVFYHFFSHLTLDGFFSFITSLL